MAKMNAIPKPPPIRRPGDTIKVPRYDNPRYDNSYTYLTGVEERGFTIPEGQGYYMADEVKGTTTYDPEWRKVAERNAESSRNAFDEFMRGVKPGCGCEICRANSRSTCNDSQCVSARKVLDEVQGLLGTDSYDGIVKAVKALKERVEMAEYEAQEYDAEADRLATAYEEAVFNLYTLKAFVKNNEEVAA